jgi:hypothetical protein
VYFARRFDKPLADCERLFIMLFLRAIHSSVSKLIASSRRFPPS